MSKVGNQTNSQDPQAVNSRVFVGNLNTFQCSKTDVERMFQRYGRLAGEFIGKIVIRVKIKLLRERENDSWKNKHFTHKVFFPGKKTHFTYEKRTEKQEGREKRLLEYVLKSRFLNVHVH